MINATRYIHCPVLVTSIVLLSLYFDSNLHVVLPFNFHSLFMAGRALENGGNIALQNLGQPERAADMYKRASDLFMQNMTPDRAAEMLEKSAKYVIVFNFISTGV